MAADPRRVERPWRNADGTWRWRGDDELAPIGPVQRAHCDACGSERLVIRNERPRNAADCVDCGALVRLRIWTDEHGRENSENVAPQSRPRMRVSRPSPDELRKRGVIV
jgi:hypothetical protein